MKNDLTAMKQEEIRRGEVEKLRSGCVGAVLHIIEDLDELKLSAEDINTILTTCGLDYKKAMLMGLAISDEREAHQG